jgi:hypothetical protein
MATASSPGSIGNSARQSYWVLRVGFTVVPIIAGIDQFTDKLANWDMYLAPAATRRLTARQRAWEQEASRRNLGVDGVAGEVERMFPFLISTSRTRCR